MKATRTQTNPQKLYQALETEGLAAGSGREKQSKTQACPRPGPSSWGPHLLAPCPLPGRPQTPSAARQDSPLPPLLRDALHQRAPAGQNLPPPPGALAAGEQSRDRTAPRAAPGPPARAQRAAGWRVPAAGLRFLPWELLTREQPTGRWTRGPRLPSCFPRAHQRNQRRGSKRAQKIPPNQSGALFILKLLPPPPPPRTPPSLRVPAPAASPAPHRPPQTNHGAAHRPLCRRPRRPRPAHASPGARDSSGAATGCPPTLRRPAEAGGARRRRV